jgi:hypothetical protein
MARTRVHATIHAVLLLLFWQSLAASCPDLRSSVNKIKRSRETRLSVGIVGGGIAGLALARALQLTGNVTATVFERDPSFSFRHQGYAITIQQACSALDQLGLLAQVQAEDVKCAAHYVFDSHGLILGCFGPALTSADFDPRANLRKERRNLHLPREKLRELLYRSLSPNTVQWGKRLVALRPSNLSVEVEFEGNDIRSFDLVVGAGERWPDLICLCAHVTACACRMFPQGFLDADPQ